VNIPAGLRLGDVFILANERKWLFSTFGALGEHERLRVRREGVVVVAALLKVRSTALGVAPDTVLQNVVPHITTSGFRERRVGAYKSRVYCIRVRRRVH
jgi:hypothetical protein